MDGNGNIIAVTGNGDLDGMVNFGESVVHLSGANLSLLDWYTPQEWSRPERSGLGSWIGRRNIDSGRPLYARGR